MPTPMDQSIIPVNRWKRIAEMPLTGNPMVDAGLVEEMRMALRLACARIEQVEKNAKSEANITLALAKAGLPGFQRNA